MESFGVQIKATRGRKASSITSLGKLQFILRRDPILDPYQRKVFEVQGARNSLRDDGRTGCYPKIGFFSRDKILRVRTSWAARTNGSGYFDGHLDQTKLEKLPKKLKEKGYEVFERIEVEQ